MTKLDGKLMPPALLLTFAIVLGAGIVYAAATDEEAVRKVVNGFPDAWNRHDMDALAALFAQDADFVNVAATRLKGRESIRVNHAFLHGTVPKDAAGVAISKDKYGIFKPTTMHFKQTTVRFLRPDIAVAHVNWEILGDPRTKAPRRGLFVMILTHDGGKWLIAVAQNTESNRTVK